MFVLKSHPTDPFYSLPCFGMWCRFLVFRSIYPCIRCLQNYLQQKKKKKKCSVRWKNFVETHQSLPAIFTGVHSNQDLILCATIGLYMGFCVHRGSWLLCPPVNMCDASIAPTTGVYYPMKNVYMYIYIYKRAFAAAGWRLPPLRVCPQKNRNIWRAAIYCCSINGIGEISTRKNEACTRVNCWYRTALSAVLYGSDNTVGSRQ